MLKMSINNNQVSTKELAISAEGIISEEVVVKSVRTSYKFDQDRKATDEIESIKYDCVDPETFSVFTIKVNTTKAVVTQEQIDQNDEATYISIPVAETFIKPYDIKFGIVKVSIVAPFVKLAEN